MMLAMANARERSAKEWKTLIERTDARFNLRKIIQPPLSNMGIIEVIWCE